MTSADLTALSRDELVALILTQAAQMAALEQELAALRAQRDTPPALPTTSRNSSQPPSQDQKPAHRVNGPKRKHRPPAGHVKQARPLTAHPEHVVKL